MTTTHSVHFAHDLPLEADLSHVSSDEEQQRPLLEMILLQQAKIEELDEKIRILEKHNDKEDFLPHHHHQSIDIATDEDDESRFINNAEDDSDDGVHKSASLDAFVDNIPGPTSILRSGGAPKSILFKRHAEGNDSAETQASPDEPPRKKWVYNLHAHTFNNDIGENINEIPLHHADIHHHHHHKNSFMRHSVFRGSLGLTDDSDEEQDILVSDTFTLMMLANVKSPSWVLGISSFLFQLILGGMVAYEQVFVQSSGTSTFNIPFTASVVVRSGQFFTIVLCLVTQKDVLSAIQVRI